MSAAIALGNHNSRESRRSSKSSIGSQPSRRKSLTRKIASEMSSVRSYISLLGDAGIGSSGRKIVGLDRQGSGLNGFDELRKYIKQGNQFCQEVAAIMQERSELESTYTKGLSKLSSKLTKAASGCIGTLASSWGMAATEMEAEAELHRSLSQALHEDIYKPMKGLGETQHKTRKPIEGIVDKALKVFIDKRSDETKCKKMSFTCAKEREKLCDQLHNSRAGRGKLTSDKDIAKLEKKVRQLNESVQKADKEYHNSCQSAEQSRQEWESAVYKGTAQLQTLEEERICQMQDFMNKYNSHLSVLGPKFVKSCERLGEAVVSVDVSEDLRSVVNSRGTGPNQPEQLLLDYYAEDVSNVMDKTRRRQALQNYLIYLQQDIERENKGREGLERLIDVYTNRPNFADPETQEETKQRLAHMIATLNFLEACRYKISGALNTLDNRPAPDSKYTQYIERTKDKLGCTVSILRLPIAILTGGYQAPTSTGHVFQHQLSSDGPVEQQFVNQYEQRLERHSSIGSSNSSISGRSRTREESLRIRRLSQASALKAVAPHPPPRYGDIYSDDEDEFDNYDMQSPTIQGQCRAIYDYTAGHYDELTIKPGDILNIYEKQDDGWWQGECQGRIGIFPATYVEELGAPH